MKLLYTTFALLATMLVKAQTTAYIAPSFETWLIEKGYDTNSNGDIGTAEAAAITTLTLEAPNTITDLTGIDLFTGLTTLDIDQQPLTEVSFTLPNILSLDVSGNTTLEELDCSNSDDLATINVLGCTNLTQLIANGCALETIDVTNMPQLIRLNLADNLLTEVDFTNTHDNLKYLYLQGNVIPEITLEDFPELLTLNLNCLDINSISLVNLPSVITLSLVGSGTETFYAENMPSLNSLNIVNNSLTGIELVNLPALSTLWLQNNQLESLTLSGLPDLTNLHCYGNSNLKHIDLSDIESLTTLNCYNVPLETLYIKNGLTENVALDNEGNTLIYICADEEEIAALQVQFPGSIINTYCSYEPGSTYNTIQGNISFDYENDGYSENEPGISNYAITYNTTSTLFTNEEGDYVAYTETGDYTVGITPPLGFTCAQPVQTVNFTEPGQEQTVNFLLVPTTPQPDLDVAILPVFDARPGFEATYKIIVHNKGNQIQSGTINLQFQDEVLDYITSSLPLSAQAANNLSWDFTNLYPFQSFEFMLTLHVNSPLDNPAVNIDDVLTFIATVPIEEGELTPPDNIFNLKQVVIGSFDPNDKQVAEGSTITPEQVGDYLHYLVRFQNTGTAEAINVVVKDVLAQNLDWGTFQPISASHEFRATLTEGNIAEFYFMDINLPAEEDNEPASHGYIAFKIKPAAGAVADDVFENTAEIYFDYNAPIITNTVSTIVAVLGIGDEALAEYLSVYPVPAKDVLHIEAGQEISIKSADIYNMLGQLVLSLPNQGTINTNSLQPGTYTIAIKTNIGVVTKKIIKQ